MINISFIHYFLRQERDNETPVFDTFRDINQLHTLKYS